MKRIVFCFLVFVASGFGSTGNACEELRKYPNLYESLMETNSRESGLKSLLGNLKVIAVTPLSEPSLITHIIVKSEMAGEPDIYFLQETTKNCTVINQSFYFNYNEVKQIIKRKRMRML